MSVLLYSSYSSYSSYYLFSGLRITRLHFAEIMVHYFISIFNRG